MDRDTRLKRLHFRSWHRGCKETDLVLGPFAEGKMQSLTPEMLDLYEQLLEEDDADIWAWVSEKTTAKPKYIPLIEMLKEAKALTLAPK